MKIEKTDEENKAEENESLDKKKLLSQAELSIWLDTYDDIFSDFDSRPLSERTLSDDFLSEAKKMVKEKAGGAISLKLLMPAKERHKEIEEIVVKSLHAHFRRFAHQIENEMSQSRRKGLLLIVLGVLIIVTAALIVKLGGNDFVVNVLRIVMEPAGWFFTWTGFDSFFYFSRGG